MFVLLFQLYGFQVVPFDDVLTMSILQGPNMQLVHGYLASCNENGSPNVVNNPIADDPPGPGRNL